MKLMPDYSAVQAPLEKLLDRFICSNQIQRPLELECRFGQWIDVEQRFQPYLSAKTFQQIKTAFHAKMFEVKLISKETYQQGYYGALRERRFEDGRTKLVRKQRLVNLDLQCDALCDVRISVSTEESVDQLPETHAKLSRVRSCTRSSYQKTDWQIDMTQLAYPQSDRQQYQLELECIDFQNFCSQGVASFSEQILKEVSSILSMARSFKPESRLLPVQYHEFYTTHLG